MKFGPGCPKARAHAAAAPASHDVVVAEHRRPRSRQAVEELQRELVLVRQALFGRVADLEVERRRP